jgi:serine/threonine protein kinase
VHLKQLSNHAHIVKLKDVVIDGPANWYESGEKTSTVALVFEYLQHDLAGLIYSAYYTNEMTFSEALVKSWVQQILKAVAAMHATGLMHRDLKSMCFFMFVVTALLVSIQRSCRT